jgi:hypothetical protein
MKKDDTKSTIASKKPATHRDALTLRDTFTVRDKVALRHHAPDAVIPLSYSRNSRSLG